MTTILSRAQELRKKLTAAEKILLYSLRQRQIGGLKFRRQAPFDSYVVDFACYEARLIIELDGGQHSEQESYNKRHTQWLEQQGYKVQRFWINEVLEQLDDVLESIWELCKKYMTIQDSTPHPILPPQGGKERNRNFYTKTYESTA